jgi:hypothetical protein
LATPALGVNDDPEQAYREARAALEQRRWSDAELLLERTLMLQPENAQALVDLALLLAQRGRTDTAQAMLTALIDDPRTPTAQRERLMALRSAYERATGPGVPLSAADGAKEVVKLRTQQPLHALDAVVGVGSNPLITTSATSLTLTLPEGNFQLPLEGRPRAAAYGSATLGWRPAPGWDLQAQAHQVDLPGVQTALRLQVQAALVDGASLQGRAQQFSDGAQRHQMMLDWSGAVSGLALGVYNEPSRRRAGWVARAGWQVTGTPVPQRPVWAVWADVEDNRLDGAPGFRAIGTGVQWPIPAAALMLQAQLSYQVDTRGYQPLLSNNAPRRLFSHHIAVDVDLHRSSGRAWLLRFYNTQRESNIALFTGVDRGVQVVWRKQW